MWRPDGEDTIFSSIFAQYWLSWEVVIIVSLSGLICMTLFRARCLIKHWTYLYLYVAGKYNNPSLMLKVHCGTLTYYHIKTIITRPSNKVLAFPAQRICIFHKKHPIIVNIDDFLQESERTNSRDDYFEQTFGICPKAQKDIDTCTSGV